MPFKIIRNDLSKVTADVIVNSAHPQPVIGGGVDFVIHDAGGPELVQARIALGQIRIAEAKYTKGFLLNSNYVFHTVGPVWDNGGHKEYRQLYSCYWNSLQLAIELKQHSIAFPLISTGAFGAPKSVSLEIALKAFKEFLDTNELDIYLVVYDKDSYLISKQLHDDISSYIDTGTIARRRQQMDKRLRHEEIERIISYNDSIESSLKEELEFIDGTFQETLFAIIDDKGFTDPYVYKKANIDRRLFAKIRKDKFYHPSKNTVLALCIALELNTEQTQDLLSRAGYNLSLSIPFDIIIHYFIKQNKFDIFEINEALFDFDQEPLGF